jgi:PAS domain-containing protein
MIVRDITEHKPAEQSLQANKDRLQLTLDAARLGRWEYDPLHHVTLWGTRLKEMFGAAEDKRDTGEFTKRVHPEDLKRMWAAVEPALDPTDPKLFATELRYLDITERQRRENERRDRAEPEHLLMLIHRAKNMLSLVQAIASQSATREPEHFV